MKKTRKSIDKTGTYQKHPSIYREDEAYTFFFFLSDLPKSEAYSIRIRDIGRYNKGVGGNRLKQN
ncbi:hypothetical protein Lalb_Chr02g0148461 [Lupinus albus]|uniref:Uncharacterized protein n=1 Tax=Lupinus albus TaxID=3870 RepID=A0A6A4QX76_LUPAL|nr:hypothetical protein Lalb_Chr02g0148461 [Lupinus albus]